ncbi:MAG: hypothetical protein IPL83_06555 [Bdellovibrionales bacterium]|nr:hypothetical protein [Bdellovibrionales bacterium]
MSISLGRLIITLLAAVLIVGLQLASLPILSIVFGDIDNRESYILFVLYLGMTAGLIPNKLTNLQIYVFSFFAFGFAILGWNLDSILGLALKNSPLSLGLLAFFAMALFWAGTLLQRATYGVGLFKNQYRYVNIANLLVLVAWVGFFPVLGYDYSLILLSALITLLVLARKCFLKGQIDDGGRKVSTKDFGVFQNIETLAGGIVSGLYVSIFFDILHIFMYPLKIKFAIYLFCAFLFLGLSIRTQKILEKLKIRSVASAVLVAEFLFIMVLEFLFGGVGNRFFFDPLAFSRELPLAFNNYQLLISSSVVFLMLPYIIFAAIIPLQERKNRGLNNLFFCTLGNTLGFLFFLACLGNLTIHSKLVMTTIFTFVICCFQKNIWVRGAALVLVLMISFQPFLGWLDHRVVSQGLRFFDIDLKESDSKKELALRSDGVFSFDRHKGHQLLNFRIFSRKDHEVGYIASYFRSTRMRLGLGGYNIALFKFHDVIRSLVAEEMVGTSTKNILVLGIGNHLTLTRLENLFKRTSRPDILVDVVDSFSLFEDISFLNTVGKEGGFSWPNSQFNAINTDALNYLSTVKPGSYDVVIWNLTWPSFGTSGKIFTRQMSELVAKALRPHGKYVTDALGNKTFDCNLRFGFAHTIQYPISTCWPFSFQVNTQDPDDPEIESGILANFEKENECKDVASLRLANSQIKPSLEKFGFSVDRTCEPQIDVNWTSISKLKQSTRLSLAMKGIGHPIIFSLPFTNDREALGTRLRNSTELFFEITQIKGFFPIYLSSGTDYFSLRQLFSIMLSSERGIFYLPRIEKWTSDLDLFANLSLDELQPLYSIEQPGEEDSKIPVRRYHASGETLSSDIPESKLKKNSCDFFNQYKRQFGIPPNEVDFLNYIALLKEVQRFLSPTEVSRTEGFVLRYSPHLNEMCSGARKL